MHVNSHEAIIDIDKVMLSYFYLLLVCLTVSLIVYKRKNDTLSDELNVFNVTNLGKSISSDLSNGNHFSNIETLNQNESACGFNLIKKGLRIGSLNVCHFLPKKDEIQLALHSNGSVYVLGLCETFLNSDINNSELAIEGFNFERKDRQKQSGGGLLIFIKNEINYKRRLDLESTDIETVWLEFKFPFKSSILTCFTYRPPSSDTAWIDLFEHQIQKSSAENLEYIILGDFNINFNPICTNTKWINTMNIYDLEQLINVPTRVTKNTSSIIDHIYVTQPENIIEVKVPFFSISDHYPVCVTHKVGYSARNRKNGKHVSMKYRCYKKFNEDLFKEDLRNASLDDIEKLNNPEECLKFFYKTFFSILDKHAPQKFKRIKSYRQPEWYNSEIHDARRLRDTYHKNKDWENYKIWRNKTTAMIKTSKQNYFTEAIIQNKDTKTLWKYIHELNPKDNIGFPTQLQHDNEIISDPSDITECLNQHFTGCAKSIKTHKPVSVLKPLENFLNDKFQSSTEMFTINEISHDDVLLSLKKLNIRKGTGLDGLGPKLLKLSANVIYKPITHIINTSIRTNVFPSILKKARITPLFKNGERENPNNYRPISVLPTISKLIERHVAKQLNTYLKHHDILYQTQSGFRENHSCHTALTKIIDTWLTELDKGNMVGSIFLDMRKAFDLVDHKILLEKLCLYNFSTYSLKWITSYLNDRTQQVQIKNNISKPELIQFGVPQGSILGPILFLLYINDLPLYTTSTQVDMYADDATFYASGTNSACINVQLQSDMENIKKWCHDNGMYINLDKTTTMLIGTVNKLSNQSDIQVYVDDKKLTNVSQQKLLGVHIDNNLAWNTHIEKLCKCLASKISLLQRLKKFLPLQARKLFYVSYIMPVMDYCCTVWGSTTQKNINCIIKLQKRAARIILNADFTTPSRELFITLDWLPFDKKIMYHKCVLVYKAINNQTPSYISNMLTPVNTINNNHTLRSATNHNLLLPKPRLNTLKRTFTYSGPEVWNKLPVDIKTASSLYVFKEKCHQYLKQMSA